MKDTIDFKKQSNFKEVWRRLKKDKLAMFGLVVFTLIVLMAICAPLITPYENVVKINAKERLLPMSAEHIFGTDVYGRDIFARCVYGARMSLMISLICAVFSLIVGSLIGGLSSYLGGVFDTLVMRLFDIISAIPGLLLAMAVVAALGSSITNLILAMAITSVPETARVVRAAVLGIVDQEYIEACRLAGMSTWRILTKHVLPNAIGVIIVKGTMSLSALIQAIATLSFLGLGINPPTPEWGALISEAKEFMLTSPTMILFPAAVLSITSFAVSVLGDGLRDALDPRLKN